MNYIDIDRHRMTINGEPATEREMVVVANAIYGQPARFFLHLPRRVK